VRSRFAPLRAGSERRLPARRPACASRQRAPAVSAQPQPRAADGFRPDIQGLRGVAVLIVVLDHAGVPGMGGGYVGVDVFFVISGFLITGWLLGRAFETARVPFGDFYATRARRILPAAALTLVATCAASVAYLNPVRALSALHDALWAAVFAANVHFAHVGVDYFARDDPPSPIQQFWTLAVEEQFYLAWPLLLAAALVVLRAGRRGPVSRRGLAGLVALGVAASLLWSIHVTASDPTAAYFSTAARAWELGTGALVAIGLPWILRLPARLRAALTWAGFASILGATVAFGPGTPFPGYAALLPVAAAGLVVGGGAAPRSHADVAVILGRQPLRLVGDLSYAFYLWHWPALVIAAQYVGHPLSTLQNLLLLAAAFALSYLTYRTYENPLRRAPRLRRQPRALALWPVTVSAVFLAAGLGMSSVTTPSAAAPSLEGGSPAVLASGQPPRAHPKTLRDALLESVAPCPAAPARPACSRPPARATAPRHLSPRELHGRHRRRLERVRTRRPDGAPGSRRARRLARTNVDAGVRQIRSPLPLEARAAHQERLHPVRDELRRLRDLVRLDTCSGAAPPPTSRGAVAGVVRLGTGRRRGCRAGSAGSRAAHAPPRRDRRPALARLGRPRLPARSRRHAWLLRVPHPAGRGCGVLVGAKRGTSSARHLRPHPAVVLRARPVPDGRRDDRHVPRHEPHHRHLRPPARRTARPRVAGCHSWLSGHRARSASPPDDGSGATRRARA
jgi:peptidoglycan/LPS O-acetylase OafA/YrhL